MKRVIITVILVALLAALGAGCGVTGPGNTVTEDKDFTDFTCVDIEGAFDVEIVQSNSFSVTISADEDYFDYIVVSKMGDTLKISIEPRHTFTDFTVGARILKADITMPALYGLEISGATEANISGFTSSGDFRVNVSGASTLVLKDIESGDTEFKVSGASKVSGSLVAEDVKFEVSGASKVTLVGSAGNMVLDASGASNVDLANYPLNNADMELSGASAATVNLKGTLDCKVTAASSLYFLGNPTMGIIDVSGASTIKHK